MIVNEGTHQNTEVIQYKNTNVLNNYHDKKCYTLVHECKQQNTKVIKYKNMYVLDNYRGKYIVQ